jgi:hypothetical protein
MAVIRKLVITLEIPFLAVTENTMSSAQQDENDSDYFL